MAAILNYDGTITCVNADGSGSWVTGTPYSPRTMAQKDVDHDKDQAEYYRHEAHKKFEKERKKTLKAEKKYNKKIQKMRIKSDKKAYKLNSKQIDICCIIY